MSDIQKMVNEIFEAMRGYISAAVGPLKGRVAALEKAVASIPAGKDGAPGRDGKDGAPGAPGARGEKGDVGISGKDGAPGMRGEKGEPGAMGPQGERGERGEAGPAGERGEVGMRGEKGEPGPKGDKGDPGERGAEGEKGLQGERGERGEPGAVGARGERGELGLAGEKGDRGEKGERGEPGGVGPVGARGEKGDPGKDGRDGREGKDGANGRDGAPGRDALELDILPCIDEQRSYPRGSFAKHAGGLWRAISNTQGMRGWECLVNGIDTVTVEQGDERRFSIGVRLSTGDEVAKEFSVPSMVYREIYRPETEYSKGDTVTYGGSLWVALVDLPTKKPGDPTDGSDGSPQQWRLAVKKGAPGKDAGK